MGNLSSEQRPDTTLSAGRLPPASHFAASRAGPALDHASRMTCILMSSAETALADTPLTGPMTERAAPGVDRFRLALLAVGHAVTDSYGFSLLAPMFPDIARRLALTHGQIGGLPVVMGLSASLAQPLLGWISDRHPRWCMVAVGPLFAALLMGWIGHARGYWDLAALM